MAAERAGSAPAADIPVQLLGAAAGGTQFVGVAIMIVSIPLNTAIARYMKKLQEKQMKSRDKRTRLMSELLANIRR